jgi:hypothetical protein
MPALEMRTSERRSLKTCVQKWYWSQVEGLVPNRAANPLWFGSAVHEGLADWYRPGLARGPHPAETFDRYLEGNRSVLVTDEDEEQDYVDARSLGKDMLVRYVDHYGMDETWEVIATERAFRVLMKRPAMQLFGRNRPALRDWLAYVGIWDGVFRDLLTGEIWLMEHKTAAGIRVDHLPLDDQAGSYWAVASDILREEGLLGPDEHIAGIRYNFLRKAMADLRPQNERGEYTNLPKKEHYLAALQDDFEVSEKTTLGQLQATAEQAGVVVLGEVSKSQPPAFFERFDVYRSLGERETMLRRIVDEAVFAEAYRRGWLPITKAPSRECGWCQFNRMCQLDEQGDQLSVEEFKESQFTVRDPYAEHQKKSAEIPTS